MKSKSFFDVSAGMMVLFFAVVAIGCSDSALVSPSPPLFPGLGKSLKLVPFQDCTELKGEIQNLLKGEMEEMLESLKGKCRYVYPGGGGGDEVQMASPGDTQSEDSKDDVPSVTGTNLHEAGVDEADLIKANGTHVFAIVGSEIKIIRVWPFSSFGQVAAISREDGAKPKGLYLLANRLLVIWSQSEANHYDYYHTYSTGQENVISEIYDVADPSKPNSIGAEKYPGSIVDSRLVNSRLYLVVSGSLNLPELDYTINRGILPECPESGKSEPTEALASAIERLRENNLKVIEEIELEDTVPVAAAGTNIVCGDVYRSVASYGGGLLTIVTNDITDSSGSDGAITIMGNDGSVYASKEGIYIASRYSPYFGLPEAEGENAEKYDSTVVHRFSIGDGPAVYTGSGSVAGHLVDNSYAGARGSDRFSMAQFAMSEHKGTLRIATTIGDPWGGTSESRVTVLDADSPELAHIGEVGGLGRGETIYAVRFIGERGYVVTFKKTDPLYVLDISDPVDPKVAGELKISGFSTYLHPFGESYIIGLGFDADDRDSFAWTQGLKLALFDVSDPASPKEVGHRLIGSRGSYSAAVEEHHAFTLDESRGILSLPLEVYEGGEGDGDYGTFSRTSVMLMRADQTGAFDTVGEIIHEPAGVSYWGGPGVLRAVIIGGGSEEGVVSLTATGITLHRIDADMSEVGGV